MKLFLVIWKGMDKYGEVVMQGAFCLADDEYKARTYARDAALTDLYRSNATVVIEELPATLYDGGMIDLQQAQEILREYNYFHGILGDGEIYAEI